MSAKRWVFTLNNPSEQESTHINDAHAGGGIAYLVSGREVGDGGTPHLQGFVCFEGRRSLLQCKALLGARVHFEIARGTNKQASDYCKKDGDFVEYGTMPAGAGHRTDWDRYREWVEGLARCPTDREIAREFPGLYARYSDKCKFIAQSCLPLPNLVSNDTTLRDWQVSLRDAVVEECTDDRSILFYLDPDGNSGKSWFCRYMVEKYSTRVQVLGVGRVTDLAYMIDAEKDIFLIDCERSSSEFLQYRVLEQLKNRMVCSTKYSGTMKILRKVPHVVVFMNEEPDMGKLTEDRYLITRLNE